MERRKWNRWQPRKGKQDTRGSARMYENATNNARLKGSQAGKKTGESKKSMKGKMS